MPELTFINITMRKYWVCAINNAMKVVDAESL